ncbi:flavin reductase family protein [Micromonospora sp. PLK6-60]|uniref:flavin reductase family protein n=1 Tax=Micromonospora sp. PLK6-60 TaxID=2873383 RepID=UPI001CA65625|nr:flavin reductase family protein [Micromonospora sp. PLK6-60]MBY8870757.1 flavin reductase family protein [Micromonospora sp. PLK6-60]
MTSVRADLAVTDVQDTTLLRRTFGAFCTGVTVLTVGGEQPRGMTANSFTAVSLDPPLVLVCVARDAVMHDALLRAGAFGVSVLSAGQERVARHFAGRRPLGAEQFALVDTETGEHSGAPLIAGAAAQLECALWKTYDGGDHTIFVGRLLAISGTADDDVLIFLRGCFGRA